MRPERTLNMYFIAVTLDVSKLSGWLNTDAPCRVERRAYDVGRDTRQKGMVHATAQRKRAEGEIAAKYWAQETRGAHQKHPAHGCDFGGIPIGDVRVEILQVVEEVAHVGDCRDVPVGDGAQVACTGRVRLKAVGQGVRGAHDEHAVHGCDA